MRQEPSHFALVSVILSAILLPLYAGAQIPVGCHPITAEERAALTLREAAIPATGFFCDRDRQLLFGSCPSDPLPTLLARYTPGTVSSAEGNRGITRLQPEFACRLSRFLTAYPHCIVSGWRSVESQQKLWDEALLKYGTEAEARKYVAPPGKSRHNTGLAADVCPLSPAAKSALSGFNLYIRLEYEPWHVEGVGLTDNESGITEPPPGTTNLPPLSPPGQAAGVTGGGTSWLTNLAALYTLANGVSSFFNTGTVQQTSGYTVTQVGNTFYVSVAGPNATSTVSLADVLMAALQSSGAPTIIFTSGTSTSVLTPVDLAALLAPSSAPEIALASTTPEDLLRSLMLRVIELLRILLSRLTELVVPV
jgi:hypothetical protein